MDGFDTDKDTDRLIDRQKGDVNQDGGLDATAGLRASWELQLVKRTATGQAGQYW